MGDGGRDRVEEESCGKMCNRFSHITSRAIRCYFCSGLSEVMYFQWLKNCVFTEIPTAESSPLMPSPLTQKYKDVNWIVQHSYHSNAKSLCEWDYTVWLCAVSGVKFLWSEMFLLLPSP